MTKPTKRLNFKALALTNEHGVWSFLLEPSLIGLFHYPTLAGLLLILSALFAVLGQHPLALYISDKRRAKIYLRTIWALRFASTYLSLSLVFFVLSVVYAENHRYLMMVFAMVSLAGLQFQAKLCHKEKELVPELIGVSVLAALLACLFLLGWANWSLTLAFWVLLTLRNLAAVLYVRARLRLERGAAILRWPSLTLSIIATLVSLWFYFAQLVTLLVVIIVFILLARNVLGLSPWRLRLKAKHIGILELIFGLILVLGLAIS